jgi:hypothetical protein
VLPTRAGQDGTSQCSARSHPSSHAALARTDVPDLASTQPHRLGKRCVDRACRWHTSDSDHLVRPADCSSGVRVPGRRPRAGTRVNGYWPDHPPGRLSATLAATSATCQAGNKREERPRCRPKSLAYYRIDGHCRRSSRPSLPLFRGLLVLHHADDDVDVDECCLLKSSAVVNVDMEIAHG